MTDSPVQQVVQVAGIAAANAVATRWLAACVLASSLACGTVFAADDSVAGQGGAAERVNDFLEIHCAGCHIGEDASGGLNLDALPIDSLRGDVSGDPDLARWETVFRRLQAHQMPPADVSPDDRPGDAETDAAAHDLSMLLDAAAQRAPRWASPPPMRRLTRTQFGHAIGELLAMDLDVARWLPADPVSNGFDHLTVDDLPPLLMNRYLHAAGEISRLAMGRLPAESSSVTVRVPPDRTQSEHVDGFPPGTRGGVWLDHFVAKTGNYRIRVRLSRDRDELVEGLTRPHDLWVLIDDSPVHSFVVRPPKDKRDQASVDRHLKITVPIQAGTRRIGATFTSQGSPLVETLREPFDARFNRHRHPRLQPAIFELSIIGPLAGSATTEPDHATSAGSRSEMPFALRHVPAEIADDPGAMKQLADRWITDLMRSAYRRDVGPDDGEIPQRFYDDAVRERRQTDPAIALADAHRAGMEAALASILVNPNFLFRVERTHPDDTPGDAAHGRLARMDSWTLASRLSFFLWNGPPDSALLDAAGRGELSEPESLHRHVARMLADPRSIALTDDFATQWLYLRNLATATPDLRQFPDFDDNLRRALEDETKSLIAWMVREDRSILDLIRPDRVFVNERLATHYGIPGVLGSHMRPVAPPPSRGGLLRQGSILMVTSYSTRTSPTVRGAWLLENLFGTPPPPPPPNVPALKEPSTLVASTVRERLAIHRDDAACAACHDRIDPLGFALEHYDAVGRYRDREADQPIDASGPAPDGPPMTGVSDLEAAILRRPKTFATAMTEKLLTFALGRTIDPRDGPAVRKIVQSAAAQDYRFSALVQAIAASEPFHFKTLSIDVDTEPVTRLETQP